MRQGGNFITFNFLEISTFEPLRGTRKIGAAITHAVQNWNEAENGKSRQKFLILFTNGYSNEDLSSASALLQKNNIRTFIVPTAILHPNSNIEPEYSQLKEIVSGKVSNFFGLLQLLYC